jgi:putative phosphoserine phosphatase/1-acylglycerol-3-phosphate O-acyltransferase
VSSPSPTTAAFFDLDRTLLAGASGPVISAALRDAGVIANRGIPGEAFVYGIFNRLGETLPSMALARQAANVAKGWSQSLVDDAAKKAAEVLLERVQPKAAQLFEEHRREGRMLVLATTTPYDLVRPLADLLGFDDVVATRYGVADDGTYNGAIVGNFVWANGKLAAVRTWATEHGIDLANSYFYSDSVYDTPLLSAVGHPVAVNPDPRLQLVATARRWPILHLDVPEGVPKILGVEPQQVAQAFNRPELIPYARFEFEGEDRVPRRGPAIVVANHRSYFDIVAMSLLFAKVGRPVRFLGKKEVFDVPVVGQVAKAFGGIRVDRGTGSDEPLQAAVAALDSGDLVAIMPQGTIPRGPAFFDPVLKGRWGAARLAHMTRVPVIPVGLWGTEKVWPRSARLPNMLNLTNPPTIKVRVGPAVDLKYKNVDKDTERIMEAIMQLLPPVARMPHTPTPEELQRTYPPGYKGDPGRETERRPGTD